MDTLAEVHKGLLPPYSNTGVEGLQVAVTWVIGTVRDTGDPGQVFELARGLAGVFGSGPGRLTSVRHYGQAVAADDGSWVAAGRGLGGAAGTALVQVRQGALDRAAGAGDLFAAVPRTLRASRVDLAWDDPEWLADPVALFAARGEAVSRTHRGSWLLTVNGDGNGATLSIGSRSSDRYGRVYVKRPAVRWESESKGAAARAVWEGLVAGSSPGALWADEWRRLAYWATWDRERASRAVLRPVARL
jgi:hypothetical protein